MKLYIDTSDFNKVTIGIDHKKYVRKAFSKKSQFLLSFIEEVLRKNKKSFQDLKEIQVNTGPGSYTGLRVGVSVANAIGWFLGIPVNGKNLRKGEMVKIKYE